MKFNYYEKYKTIIIKINDNKFKSIKNEMNFNISKEEINELYKLVFINIFKKQEIVKINYFEELKKISEFKKSIYLNLIKTIQIIESNELLIDKELINNFRYLINSNNIEKQIFIFYNYLSERDNKLNKIIKDYEPILFRHLFFYQLISIQKKDLNFLFNKQIDYINLFEFIFSNNVKTQIINKSELCNFILDYNFDKSFLINLKNLNYLFDVNDIKKINKKINNLYNENYINNEVKIDNKELNFESIFYYKNNQKKIFNDSKDVLNKSLENITDKIIINGFLTFDNELEKQNIKENELFEELRKIDNKINSLLHTDQTTFSNLLNACNDYFNFVRTSNEDYLNSLIENYNNSFDKSSLFSSDFCSLIYLVFYTLYSAINEEPLKDINNDEEYKKRQKKLKGIKSLPGYLEINQIKFEPWKATSSFAKDNKFLKSYSCFYNFYTKQENPFNDLLEDEDFEFLQDLAIKGREKLEGVNEGVLQKKIENIFYKPLSDGTHSIYTYVNIIADFFKELNEPVDFEILENFGISLIDFLKNLALETGSSILLEFVLELFSKEFINFNGKKYSIMGIYNELYMIKKIFYLINNDEGDLNDIIYQNLNEISNTLLEESELGRILKEEGYLALSGYDMASSIIDINYILSNFNLDNNELTKSLYKLNDDKSIWNLKSKSLPAWITVKFLISKEKYKNNNLNDLDFSNFSYLNNWINTLTESERSYSFLCSIKDKYEYLLKLNNIFKWNYTNEEIQKIVLLLPNSFNDGSLNLYNEYIELNKNYSNVLKLTGLKDYKNYLYSINGDLRFFSNVVRYNYDKINQLLSRQNKTPVIDLILRLLPTTRLLFGTFKLPLDQYLDKLLSWFDDLLFTVVNFLKKLVNENKIKFVEQYKRERLYLIKNNFEYKIRAFNILLDIIYLNLGSASLCISNNLLNDKEIIFDIYKQTIDKIKNIKEDNNIEENKKDPNIVEIIGNIQNKNDINEEEKEKIKDKIKTIIDNKIIIVDKKDENNSFNNTRVPIIIYPNNSNLDKNEIVKELEKQEVVKIKSDEELLKWLELEKPGKVSLDYDKGYANLQDFFTNDNPKFKEIKNDIYLSYINRDLNQIFLNNTSQNYIYQLDNILNERYNELTNINNINFSDSSYLYFVDFKKINSKLLVDILDKFDLKEYEDMKRTSLEVMSSF